MTIRIQGIEDSRKVYISLSDIVAGAQTRRREIIDVTSIVQQEHELLYMPLDLSETVVHNGLVLTDGVEYDYVLSGKTITFNNDVLTPTGHILINYYSL